MSIDPFLVRTYPNSVVVKIKRMSEEAEIPEYSHHGDSGFDLATIETVIISPGETVLIDTGLAFELPYGKELQIRPRSGLSAKTGLRICNSPGTVDMNFRGEVKIIVQNTGDTAIILERGDRIAQGVICPVYYANFVEVDELNETSRGESGFGSTLVSKK